MLQLNDDCLEYICRQLNVEQQIVLKNVCRRLEQVVLSIWRLDCRQVELNSVQCNRFRDDEFLDFMSSISGFVEQLKFSTLDASKLHLLKDCRFVQVKCLDVGELWNDDETSSDDNTLLISRLFPRLEKLKLISTITGKYIDRLTNLTHLDVSCCEELDTSYFEDIFTKLPLRSLYILYYGYNTLLDERIEAITKCQTLEELRIDDHHLILIIDKLLAMSNIRRIICYTRDYDEFLTGKIADCKGDQVDSFIFNDVLWSKDDHIDHLAKMPNLTKLVLNEDDFETGQMTTLAPNLRRLQELHVTKCRLDNGADVLCFVEHCKELRVLNVSGNTKIDNKFVWKVVQALKERHNERRTPLELRCFNTSIEEDVLKLNEDQAVGDKLKLNFQEWALEMPCTRCIECTFNSN